jgi:2-dehydropantoate 2-reductase
MKAAVIGVGGVGGYLASLLAKNNDNVTVVARGKRGESIKKNGLIMDSEQFGHIVTHPNVISSTSEISDQDIIFICVKNYSLEEVCSELRDVISPKTIIVPVMNGVDPGDRVRRMLPENTVIDSLIYIISFSREDYSIRHACKFGIIPIGIDNPTEDEKKAIDLVYDYMKSSEIDVQKAEDIKCEIWRKYVLNASYNVATARFKTTIGPLRDDPQKAHEFEELTREAYNLGLALGIKLKPEHLDYIFDRFYNVYADDDSSSLERDLSAGRKTEIETFSGYIVKTAEKLGVPVPVSKKYYEELLKMV